jgi:branched-chain amino acid transport system ATP-binding protein
MESLILQNVTSCIDKIPIIKNFNLSINEGECVTLFGRNGAGKTSLLKTVLGIIQVTTGTIKLFGHNITNLPTYKRIQLGISFVPEDRRLIPFLTARDNIFLGLRGVSKSNETRQLNEFIIKFEKAIPELKKLWSREAIYLSGGEQKMIAILRALAQNPRILLVDEPMIGLSPRMKSTFINLLQEIRDDNNKMSIIVTESDVKNIISDTNRIVVIERGELAYEGGAQTTQTEEFLKKI